MGYEKLIFDKASVFLVTGGAGFIGSHLCEALIKMKLKVRCLDNLSNGKMDNIAKLMNNPDFTFLYGDITDLKKCAEACKGVDYVLHQAAWGSVPRSILMPLEYNDINIKGTLNILEAARLNGVKRVVYASSSSVYGDDEGLPKEEGREGKLLSPYAITKRTDELYGKLYTKLYGLETIGLRYFNVFGEKQDSQSNYAAVIPIFFTKLLHEEPPVIYGDGMQSRDFTYIENVVEANLKACIAAPLAAGEVYNIACQEEWKLIDIYRYISSLLGTSVQPVYEKPRQGDIRHSLADISKARKLLLYEPEWGFERGITRAALWYKENL